MADSKKECRSCRFYLIRRDLEMDGWAGYCVRFPPIFKMEKSVNDGWPYVHGQSWCGEFKRGRGPLREIRGD